MSKKYHDLWLIKHVVLPISTFELYVQKSQIQLALQADRELWLEPEEMFPKDCCTVNWESPAKEKWNEPVRHCAQNISQK